MLRGGRLADSRFEGIPVALVVALVTSCSGVVRRIRTAYIPSKMLGASMQAAGMASRTSPRRLRLRNLVKVLS